ncbi:MAG: hypothetical protein JRF40_05740 [Deltaproteobacteria bacterium]|nr:hypothetical protein [Deltaproteobacteria bacterium]MBW2218976.1 hypothetical protein [Deltaproteobacteria bacterium]
MIKIKFFLCLLFLLLLSTTSCQTSEPVRRSPEYASGKKLADVYAKKDALKLTCSHHRGKTLSVVIRKHLETMETERSEDFQSGFSAGYKTYFPHYTNIYCGR